ncbi:MAG TPA: hypothetical protein VHR42_01520 [Clostridia bacterium]|nr:hypothetical protein [Clostridia bacterium]
MPKDRNKNSQKSKGQNPGYSNDQLGENSGEGRMMKDQEKKEKKKS